MKNEEQENLPKWGEWVMANFAAIERDREETITAPDGKEYPIRDNEQKIMMNIDKSWQAHNLQVGRIYVYAGTMEAVRLVNVIPCEGVWLETFDGQSVDNGAGITIPFEDLLYASKDEVEDYLEDLRTYRNDTSTPIYK